MSEVRIPANATAASLVGSLSVFSLIEVLDLLDRTGRNGELEVVSAGLDVRLWVDAGCLVEESAAPGAPGAETPPVSTRSPVLFESACADAGWFYFTEGATLPTQATRQPLSAVLAELGPSVAEWRELVAELPASAILRLADAPPNDDVSIKASEWRLLSMVGNSPGQTIRLFLDTADLDPIELLRTLRGLLRAGLIEADTSVVAEVPAPPAPPVMAPAPPPPVTGDALAAETAPAADPSSIAWTAESAAAHEAAGSVATAAPPAPEPGFGGEPAPPFFPTDGTAAPAPAPPAPPVSGMPPPISGDPWSSMANH